METVIHNFVIFCIAFTIWLVNVFLIYISVKNDVDALELNNYKEKDSEEN